MHVKWHKVLTIYSSKNVWVSRLVNASTSNSLIGDGFVPDNAPQKEFSQFFGVSALVFYLSFGAFYDGL